MLGKEHVMKRPTQPVNPAAQKLAPALLNLTVLFSMEGQRGMMAAQRNQLPPELLESEQWKGDDDNGNGGMFGDIRSFDAGVYMALSGQATVLMRSFNPLSRENVTMARNLLGIGAKLCRKRYEAQEDKRDVAAQAWIESLRVINQGLKFLASITSNVTPKPPSPNQQRPKTDRFTIRGGQRNGHGVMQIFFVDLDSGNDNIIRITD